MKSFKDYIQEVAQPLSQGERNFKELHGSLEPTNRNAVPGVTDQDFLFKGHARAMDPKTASYESEDEAIKQYDKNLQMHPQTSENDLKQMGEEIKDPLKYKNFKLPPQQGAKKGVVVGGEEQVHVGKMSVAEEYKDPDKHYDKQSQKMKDAINLHLRKGKTYRDAVRSAKVHVKEGWVALGPASKPGEKPKGPFNKLGGLESGSKVYGDMPKQKASGRTHKGATDIASMRKEEVSLDEKTLTPAEKAKREEIVKAMKRQGAAKDERTYAIATAQAKKVAEEVELEEGLVDAFAHERNDNSGKLQDWSMDKLNKFRKIPHGSHSKADIEAEHKRRVRTSEYENRRSMKEDYDMDYEGEMAKAELNAICDKAGVLAEMLDNDTQLEAWLQSKITKAKFMIDSVYDYMMYSKPNIDPQPDQSSSMASNYDSFLNRMGGQ